MSRQAGFVSVAMITFLPLLLALGGGLIALAFVLYANRILETTCSEEVIKAQSQVSERLNALLAMNPEAGRLRRQLMLLSTTGAPAALAFMQIRIQAFNLRQTAALANLNRAAALSMRTAPQRLTLALERHRLRGRALQTSPPQGGALVLARPVPIHPLLKIFQPVPSLERLQAQTLKWTVLPDRLLESYLPSSFLSSDLRIFGSCAGSIYQRGERWYPTLVPAR